VYFSPSHNASKVNGSILPEGEDRANSLVVKVDGLAKCKKFWFRCGRERWHHWSKLRKCKQSQISNSD